MNLDLLPKSERVVEVPFAIRHCYGKVLDVGQDRVGYTQALRDKGCEVKSCDVAGTPDYLCRFEDLEIDDRFDVVLLLSSLEHFCPDEQNLVSLENDVYCINRCKSLLKKNGKVVITVPYGRQYIAGDFIQWSCHRIDSVRIACGVRTTSEKVYVWDGSGWGESSLVPMDNIGYHNLGAMGAGAVYLGVWTF